MTCEDCGNRTCNSCGANQGEFAELISPDPPKTCNECRFFGASECHLRPPLMWARRNKAEIEWVRPQVIYTDLACREGEKR